MTNETIAQWGAMLPNGRVTAIAMTEIDDGYALLSCQQGKDWRPMGVAFGEAAAHEIVGLIDWFAARPEFSRIGGVRALSGLDTDHPGVEWIGPSEPSDDPDPLVRLMAGGLRRLWVAPSTDGSVVGLLSPERAERQLGEFVSPEAADLFISMIDALLGVTPWPM